MKNNCWLCGGTRRHSEHMMREFLINGRLIYLGKLCLETIVIQHVLDFESKDKAMSERANWHEAEAKEEPITKCSWYECNYVALNDSVFCEHHREEYRRQQTRR